jgi:hypothetical protein
MNEKFTLMHGMEHTKFLNAFVGTVEKDEFLALPRVELCLPIVHPITSSLVSK